MEKRSKKMAQTCMCLVILGALFASPVTMTQKAHASSEAMASTSDAVKDAPFTRTPEALCPTEKFDAVTVQGKYLGWQIPHSPSGTITVRLRDSHAPLHIITTPTRAKSLFGDNYDAPVEVTYDFIQHYSREDKKCHQLYVLKTGKMIDKEKKNKFYH